MICDHDYWVFSSGKAMLLLLQGLDDSEEFPIIDIVVLFCRREGGRMIGTQMEISVGILLHEAVREASVMMKKGLVVSGILITRADRNISLSLMNVLSCSFPHWKVTPFLVRL